MKKLLFIGHEYHKKTKSSDFIQDILKKYFDVDFFTLDPYKDSINKQLSVLKNKDYDVLVLWQMMPSMHKLKKYIKFKYCAFFPMYDDVPDLDSSIWYQYRNVNIINFSKTLHDKLKNLGFSSYYFQYFPKPIKITDWGEKKSIFLWQRTKDININTLEKIIDFTKIKHIHFHKSIDPGHEFIEPRQGIVKNITFSTWFEKREDMQKEMQKSAIYIAPRAFEGIGMSFLEAMAMGRCVISPDNPTMNEYIVNGENGILYDVNNPKYVDLNNVGIIQKNAESFIKRGYKKWEIQKWEIINILTTKPIYDEKNLKLKYDYNVNHRYYLFNILYILSISEKRGHKIYKLFNFIPFLLIKHDEYKKRVYLFGIPILKIRK